MTNKVMINDKMAIINNFIFIEQVPEVEPDVVGEPLCLEALEAGL